MLHALERGGNWRGALKILANARGGRRPGHDHILDGDRRARAAAPLAARSAYGMRRALCRPPARPLSPSPSPAATMIDAGVRPNTITYSSVATALERSGKWKLATRLLAKLRADGDAVDRILCNTWCRRARGRGGEGDGGARGDGGDGIEADRYSYNGLPLHTPTRSRSTPPPRGRLGDGGGGGGADLVSFNSLITALGRAATSRARCGPWGLAAAASSRTRIPTPLRSARAPTMRRRRGRRRRRRRSVSSTR